MLFNLKNFIKKFKKWILIALFGGTALASGLSGIPQDLYNNLNVKVYSVCDLQSAKRISIADDLQNFKARNSDNSLRELNAGERADFKSCEIAKKGNEFAGIYTSTKYGTRIEIIGEVKAIEINRQHGIELFARAWKGGKQLGFGKDGSVEIERFRIFNPPILVDDPNGTIIREWTDDITGLLKQRKLREDLLEATRQVIAHNAQIVGIENALIVVGKVGNTTSTFYPDAGDPGTTSVDGRTRHQGVDEAWATFIAANAEVANNTGTELYTYLRAETTTNKWDLNDREHFLFDSSSIPDTDVISSATFSLYGNGTNNDAFVLSLNVYATNPASNTTLATTDHTTVGATAFSTAKAQSTILTTGYKDWALNASGITNVSKTGVSKFGFAYVNLQEGPEPTWSSGAENYWGAYHADQAGTANDPKLVVEHSVPSAAPTEEFIILFE